MKHVETARTVFVGGLVLSKVVLITILIVFAYRNTYTTFIQKHPRQFLNESMLLGGSTAVPVALAMIVRGYPMGNVASYGIAAFSTFFFVNVLLELSMQNKIAHQKSTLTETEQAQASAISSVKQLAFFEGAVFIVCALMLALAYAVRDTGPGPGVILIESIVVGLSAMIPAVVGDRNRNVPVNLKGALSYFVPFAVIHVILQLGGVYRFK